MIDCHIGGRKVEYGELLQAVYEQNVLLIDENKRFRIKIGALEKKVKYLTWWLIFVFVFVNIVLIYFNIT